jgi:hypothetical protein
MHNTIFSMVRKQVNRSWEMSLQGPLTLTLSPPSLELALILCSLEAINEIVKGSQEIDVEVKALPFGVGNLEGSRNLERGPPLEDITREL